MGGRQFTTSGLTTSKKSKGRKGEQKRSLNALAIATKQNPDKLAKNNHRLGQTDDDGEPKRRKRAVEVDEDSEENDGRQKRRQTGAKHADRDRSDVEEESDSDGNQWKLGDVGTDEDSELDSDEAMGESDEERYEGFTFRGSSSSKSRKGKKQSAKPASLLPNLDEDEGVSDEAGEETDDGSLGDEAIDLAAMLDATADEEADLPGSNVKARKSSTKHERHTGSEPSEDGSSDEVEDSDALASDSDAEQDEVKLSALHDLVSSLEPAAPDPYSKRKRLQDDNMESRAPSDFGLTSSQKLTLADLVPSVTDPTLQRSLKLLEADSDQRGAIKTGGIPQKLAAPLSKRQQDRLDRAAAYVKSKETLDRWMDTVKHNRRAEHLSFPLFDPEAVPATSTKRMAPASTSAPQNELESTIRTILEESGLVTAEGMMNEGKIQAFEELQLNQVSLEEVEVRRAQLRKTRELLFREEVRARRIKKIKSKSFRRVHRRQREKDERATKEALQAAGIELSEDEMEAADRRRAEARMGARHRDSKWAKSVKASGRAAWDEEARMGVTEMARRGEELRKRIEGKAVQKNGDEEDTSSDSSDDEVYGDDGSLRQGQRLLKKLDRLDGRDAVDATASGYQLSSMDFMKKADAARKAENDQATKELRRMLNGGSGSSSEDEELPIGRRTYGPQIATSERSKDPKAKPSSEDVERIDTDSEAERPRARSDEPIIIPGELSTTKARSTAKKTATLTNPFVAGASSALQIGPFEAQPFVVDAASADPASPATQVPKSTKKSKALPRESRASANTSEWTTVETGPHHEEGAVVSEEEKEDPFEGFDDPAPATISQQELKIRAFAGDEVEAAFAEEKKKTIEDEDEKIIDTTLAGWGRWVGSGLSERKGRRKTGQIFTKVEGVKAQNRKDAKLDRVIINEKKVKKNVKYLASSLPHPFETRQQYERSLRLPIGPEWTTKETFQDATKPRVMIKQGIIAPMTRPLI